MCLDADTAPRSAGTNQQPPAPLMLAPQEPPLQALLKARQAHEAGCGPVQTRTLHTAVRFPHAAERFLRRGLEQNECADSYEFLGCLMLQVRDALCPLLSVPCIFPYPALCPLLISAHSW